MFFCYESMNITKISNYLNFTNCVKGKKTKTTKQTNKKNKTNQPIKTDYTFSLKFQTESRGLVIV